MNCFFKIIEMLASIFAPGEMRRLRRQREINRQVLQRVKKLGAAALQEAKTARGGTSIGRERN